MKWTKYPAYAARPKGITWEEYCEKPTTKVGSVTGGIIPSENICGGFVAYINHPTNGRQVKVGFASTESSARSLLQSKLIEHSKHGNQI
jgi:hypothetical protein